MAILIQQVMAQLADERQRLSLERTVLRLKQKKLDDAKAETERERAKIKEAIRVFVSKNTESHMDRQISPQGDRFCCQFMFDARFVDRMFAWGNSQDRIHELAEMVSCFLAPEFAKAMLGYNSIRPVVTSNRPTFVYDDRY